mgnify:CR=1 FL=1
MNRHAVAAWSAAVLLVLGAGTARAADPRNAAPLDSTPPPVPRAGWLADRLPLRVGDLVTVVVDEQTTARAQVSRTAIGDRSMTANLNANMSTGTGDPTNTAVRIASSLDRDSRDQGKADRLDILADYHGVWDCSFVGACSEVCPKSVDPAAAIQQMKVDGAIEWWKQKLPGGKR